MSSVTGVSIADELPGPDGRPSLTGDGAGTGRLGDRLFGGAARGAGILVIALVSLVGAFLLVQAIPAIADDKVNFLTSREWSVDNSNDLRFGIVELLWTTVAASTIAMIIAVPVGVAVALFITQYAPTWLSRPAANLVDLLTGVPSIVAGLFVFALWVATFDFKRVGFAVCLALVLLMIPVVVRSTEEMLKLVPNELREASYALGVPKWKTIMKVVLPTAFSGIVTGVLLGMARVMGETAPLLILGPYTKTIATDLFSGLMPTLPTMINQDRTENLQPAIDRVWAAALTLILLVLLLNLAGRFVARFGSVKK